MLKTIATLNDLARESDITEVRFRDAWYNQDGTLSYISLAKSYEFLRD